jgi:hypothetical protein
VKAQLLKTTALGQTEADAELNWFYLSATKTPHLQCTLTDVYSVVSIEVTNRPQ